MKKTFKSYKNNKREFLKTKKKEVVDYFPRGGSKEDFTYNTTIIDRGAIRDTNEKKFLRKKRAVQPALEKVPEKEGEMELLEEAIQLESEVVDKASSRALLPKFRAGDMVLLTISEIRKDYMVANYSRNKKAMIHTNYSGIDEAITKRDDFSFANFFRVGQFVTGAVVSPGNDIQLPQGYLNKKLLVTIAPKIINTGMRVDKLVVGMDLYGKLTLDAKMGNVYSADFGFTDEEDENEKFAKGVGKNKKKNKFDFNDMDDENEMEEENSIIDENEIEDENSNFDENDEEMENLSEEENNLKRKNQRNKKQTKNSPKFVEVVLVDNTESPSILSDKLTNSYYFFKVVNIERKEGSPKTLILSVSLNFSKYKFTLKKCDSKLVRPGFYFKANVTRSLTNGVEVAFGGNIGSIFTDHLKSQEAKVCSVRVIHVNAKGDFSLSAKKNILNLAVDDVQGKRAMIGKVFPEAKIAKVLFGGSYEIELKEENQNVITAFLHDSQRDERETKKLAGDIFPSVVIKEYNFFDDKPMLTAKSNTGAFLVWDTVQVGNFLTGVISEIKSDKLIVKLNNFISGVLPRDHLADFPLSKIPKKYKVGSTIKVRVFAFDERTKFLQFTVKESLMDENVKLTSDIKQINEGEDLSVVYLGSDNLFLHSGKVMAKLVHFKRINDKEHFKVGKLYTYKVLKTTSTKVILSDRMDVVEPGLGDFESVIRRYPILKTLLTVVNKTEDTNNSDIRNNLIPGDVENFEVVPVKKLLKLLTKKGIEITKDEDIEVFTKHFLIARLVNSSVPQYGIIPFELVADFHLEKVFNCLNSKSSVLPMLVLYSKQISAIGVNNNLNNLLFITPKRSLVLMKNRIPRLNSLIGETTYVGFVNRKAKNGVVVQFLEDEKSLVRIRDKVNESQENNNNFRLGQTVVVKYFKSNDEKRKSRFDFTNVYSNKPLQDLKEEAEYYLEAYLNDMDYILNKKGITEKENVNKIFSIKCDSLIEGRIGIIKDYGLLVSLKTGEDTLTGFLKNEHMKDSAEMYKVGVNKQFRVIDIDFTDGIIYLTDKENNSENNSENTTSEFYKQNKNQVNNFVVELFHDNHISAALESNSKIKAIIPCNLFNLDYESSKLSDLYKIGDVISNLTIKSYNENFDKLVTEPPVKLLTKISSNLQRNKKTLAVGNDIRGRINGVKGGYVYVYIDKQTLGRIHISDFKRDIESVKNNLEKFRQDNSLNKTLTSNNSNTTTSYPEELKVNCRILHIETKDNIKIIDLTEEGENQNNKTNQEIKNIPSEFYINSEKENTGIISRLDPFNKFPIKIEPLVKLNFQDKEMTELISNVRIHFSEIPVDKIPSLKWSYKLGDYIKFFTHFDKSTNEYHHSFSPILNNNNSTIEIDKTYPVRILKTIPGRGLIVDLAIKNTHKEAFVDICEISDDLHPNPLKIFKLNTLTVGRVTSFDTKLNKYIVSLRHSLVDEEHYSIIKNGSTLKFNKTFAAFEAAGDLRNKIVKFGVNSVLEANLVVLGYITASSEKGVFIKLANDVIVRASLRELTDEKTTQPFSLFKVDSLVLCRIVSIYKPKDQPDAKANINVSLRESVVKYNLTMRTKDLNANNFFLCTVMNETEDKFEVCVVGSTFVGILKKKKVTSHVNVRDSLVLQLVKCDKNNHPPKLRFAQNEFEENLVINRVSETDFEKNKVYASLWENVKDINEKWSQDEVALELRELEKNIDKIDYEALIKSRGDEIEEEENDVDNENDVEEENEEDEENEIDEIEDENEEDEDDMMLDHHVKSKFLKGLIAGDKNNIQDEDEENDEDVEDVEDMEIEENDEMEIDDNTETNLNSKNQNNENNENVNSKKPSNSKKREQQHLKEEMQIREIESETTKEETSESVSFYEKQIMTNPNSSLFWIQYGAYILDKLNLNQARKIFERAITTIDISLSKEKMNVWIALMNLENTYGTAETFKSVVERALQVNDKKTVYKHLISIYKLSGKFDLAHEVYKIVLKNFFSDFNLWKNYLDFLFEVEKIKSTLADKTLKKKYDSLFIEPKEGLNKALQVLGKNKQVEVLVFWAGLQYKYEHFEEARNTFASILNNFPKRSDIWTVYIDKEIKHTKNVEKVRALFEKVMEVDFKIKSMKTMIKKFLEFERDYGTPKSLEHVKGLTQKVILEKMNKLQEEGEENKEDDMEIDG